MSENNKNLKDGRDPAVLEKSQKNLFYLKILFQIF
jgi:hypothetical protein